MRRKVFVALALCGWLTGSAAFAVAPLEALNGLTIRNPEPATVGQVQSPWSAAPEWTAFKDKTNQDWTVEWTQATGLPHRAIPAGYDAAVAAGVIPAGMTDRAARAAVLDASSVDRMSRALYDILRSSYPALPAGEDLKYIAIEKEANVWWVVYGQYSNGVRVDGARADFRYSADGKLLYFGLDLIPGTFPAASTVLDAAAAERAAIDALVRGGLSANNLRTAVDVKQISTERVERTAWVAGPFPTTTNLVYLTVVSADGKTITPRAAWIVRTQVSDPPARFASWVDAGNGQILRRENEIDYDTISGTGTGDTQMATPFDPYVNLPERHLRITVDGVGDAFTNPDGTYSITTPDNSPRQVTSALTGHFGAVSNQGGPNPLFSGQATPGVPFPVNFDDSNSDPASRDAYYFVNYEHDYIRAMDPNFVGLDYEVPIYVNENQTCNAFWDGYSVNFFQAGDGCTNTGQIADVIYHEYGHGVSQVTMAPSGPSGDEGEGFSDFAAATITDQPLIGRGFFGEGTWLRDCENNRRWPAPECGSDPHCYGEIIAGALWDMRTNLIARYGHARGVSHADSLFHFARYGRQQTFDGYYFDVLAQDDDNGTLVDGSPNARLIIPAFYDNHNVGPGWTLDILHTPLHDTEDYQNPYPVVAVFSSPAQILADSCGVYYSTEPMGGGPVDGPHHLQMAPTGNLREYQALIPAQPLGTEVLYYIKGVADTLGLVALDPPDAPANQHTFNVNTDHVPPVISHFPLYNKSEAIWPAQVAANVTDNVAVGSVQVEWKRNNVDQTPFALNQVGNSTLYQGAFNGGAIAGDQIKYRIKAVDTAQSQNTTYLPFSGYYNFSIVHDVVDNVEHGQQDLQHAVVTSGFHDQWHIDTRRSHSPTHAWKFGDTGGGNYLDSSDGALFTPPVHLGTGAGLSFWHWIAAETNDAHTAWDGAVVELTTDGGTSWNEIAPAGGYEYTIVPNPASPFPPNYPCWSGRFDWRQAQFDLSAFAGQTVQVRLRFGSDGAVSYEGWYIDDFDLNPGLIGSGVAEGTSIPARSGILASSPNPFHPRTTISFAVAAGADKVRLDVVDVTGRRVRTLVDGALLPGIHSAVWDGRAGDGRPVGSGIYFTRLQVGKESFTSKLVFMK